MAKPTFYKINGKCAMCGGTYYYEYALSEQPA